jgi:hypothetical protein
MSNYFFLILLLFFAYLNFGLLLVRKTKLKLTSLESILLASVLSIAVLVSLIVFLGFFLADKSYYLLFVSGFVGILAFKNNLPIFKDLLKNSKKEWFIVLLLLIGILILAGGLFFSGYAKDGQVYLQDLYDTSWHIALEQEVLKNFPPLHPSSSALLLKNYHYFYDVFLASLYFYSHISFVTLNYKVSQLIISALLVLSAYAFGKRLKDRRLGIILTLLTIFAGNFGYLVPLFLKDQPWTESSFWVSQTFSMLVNPQLIFSFTTLYLVLLLMTPDFLSSKSRHYLLIPLIATSIGFKTYGWMIISFLYALDLLIEIIFKKKFINLLLGLIYLLFALPFIYLITAFKSGSFFYQPLWYIDTMIEAPDRVNNIRWRFLLDHYILKNNLPRIIWLRIKELFIFYFGNLGSRAIFIFLPLITLKESYLKQRKIIWLSSFAFIFTSVFPLLFLQSGTVWNSIQFWYYTLIFANILAALTISGILNHLKLPLKYLFLAIFISLTIPAFVKTMSGKLDSFQAFPIAQLELLSNFNANDNLLICPEESLLFKSSFINAYTKANVYLSDEGQMNLVKADLEAIDELKTIFDKKHLTELESLIDREKINYILCSNKDIVEFIDKSFFDQKEQLFNWSIYSLKESAIK